MSLTLFVNVIAVLLGVEHSQVPRDTTKHIQVQESLLAYAQILQSKTFLICHKVMQLAKTLVGMTIDVPRAQLQT